MQLLSHDSHFINKQNQKLSHLFLVRAGFLQVSSVQGAVIISAAPCILLLCNFIELSLPSFEHLL